MLQIKRYLAMTVPALMQNHQRKTYVTQLHKVYSEVQQALMQYQNDKNAVNLTEAGLNSKASVQQFFNEYFKVIQTCEGVKEPCFAPSYKNINGGAVLVKTGWGGGTCFTMASGSSICMDYPTLNGSHGWVFIDTNSKQGPNILGRDAFYLAVFSDGVLDVNGATAECRKSGICGAEGGTLEELRGTADNCKSGSNESSGAKCFGQILNDNWEMNY